MINLNLFHIYGPCPRQLYCYFMDIYVCFICNILPINLWGGYQGDSLFQRVSKVPQDAPVNYTNEEK